MKFVSGFHLDGATVFFHHTVFILDNFHIPFLPTFQPSLMLPIDVPQLLRVASVHISLPPFTPSYHQSVLLSDTIMKNKGHRIQTGNTEGHTQKGLGRQGKKLIPGGGTETPVKATLLRQQSLFAFTLFPFFSLPHNVKAPLFYLQQGN